MECTGVKDLQIELLQRSLAAARELAREVQKTNDILTAEVVRGLKYEEREAMKAVCAAARMAAVEGLAHYPEGWSAREELRTALAKLDRVRT